MLKFAKLRLQINKAFAIKDRKKAKWLDWLITKLRKKGYLVGNICAYKNTQIVGEVKQYGGAYIFWSKACTGCYPGLNVIEEYKKTRQLPTDFPCVLLKSVLISLTPIKKGDIINLPPLKVNR